MERTKYQIKLENHSGDVIMEFRPDGVLAAATVDVPALNAYQVGWLLQKLSSESMLHNKAQMEAWRLKVYPLKVDVTFDLFYQRYPKKRDRKKAEAVWNKMPEAERVRAFNYVNTYVNTLPPRTEPKYPNTYLNSEVWND